VSSAGFEDREDHRIPFASAYVQHNSLADFAESVAKEFSPQGSFLNTSSLPHFSARIRWLLMSACSVDS
jgi:hypothetical protein